MSAPTSTEIQRVREWECSRTQHSWDVIEATGTGPVKVVCSNCGADAGLQRSAIPVAQEWNDGYRTGYASAQRDRGRVDEVTIWGCPLSELKALGVDPQDIELCMNASLTKPNTPETEAAMRRVAEASRRRNDNRPRPSTSTPNPSNYEDKGSPPWPPFVGRAASRLFRRDRSSSGE